MTQLPNQIDQPIPEMPPSAVPLTRDDEPMQDGYYWIRSAGFEIMMMRRERDGLWARMDPISPVRHPFAWWFNTWGIVAIERVKPASWIHEGGA